MNSFLEQQNLKVKLDVFEGPLDLLLYLIRKSEVDIYHIPLLSIINQYLEYVKMAEHFDLDIGGDFILMSASLLHIKSRMLLPVEERPDSDEDDEDDPRSELIQKLIEYKKFKEVSGQLQGRAEDRSNSFQKPMEKQEKNPEQKIDMGDITVFHLVEILEDVLTRHEDDIQFVSHEDVRLEDKMAMIRETLKFSHEFKFQDLFMKSSSKIEIVVIFFAILELISLKEIRVHQPNNFGDILIKKKEKK